MDWTQLHQLLPVGVVLGAALAVVLLSLALAPKDRYVLGLVGLAGCVLGLGAVVQQAFPLRGHMFAGLPTHDGGPPDLRVLGGAFVVDGFALCIGAVALLAGAGAILCSGHEDENSALTSGEYYALILLAVSGMLLLGMAHDFLTLVISLEVMSVSTYILAGSRREDVRSGEAALKYLVLGGFSTAFLLMGVAFIYGATGSFDLSAVHLAPGAEPRMQLVLLGLGLLLVGVLFKIGAVPFHFWIPDVYEGAPTGVTALMAVGVKAAAFAVVARVTCETFSAPGFRSAVSGLLAAAAVATMVLANLTALYQASVKRMLAYSGIAHTGYLLLAFLLRPESSPDVVCGHIWGAFFYLLAYGVVTVGAFTLVGLRRTDGRPLETLKDYTGLAKERPLLALCMAVFMLSLAGMPPFAGFFAKSIVFRGAIQQDYILAAVVGILASVASFYYYLRVILEMYMAPEAEAPAPASAALAEVPWTASFVILGCAAATVLLGLLPQAATAFK